MHDKNTYGNTYRDIYGDLGSHSRAQPKLDQEQPLDILSCKHTIFVCGCTKSAGAYCTSDVGRNLSLGMDLLGRSVMLHHMGVKSAIDGVASAECDE